MSDQGFEEFFRDHHLSLYRALYLLTGEASEAEDVLQDAFLRVWRRWDRVAHMDRPVGYLYRTAMNEFRRRARRRSWRPTDEETGSHEDDLRRVEDRDEVVRALGILPPRQRAALVLVELLDCSSEEAANWLRVRPQTVRSLASQGRAALRNRLGVRDE